MEQGIGKTQGNILKITQLFIMTPINCQSQTLEAISVFLYRSLFNQTTEYHAAVCKEKIQRESGSEVAQLCPTLWDPRLLRPWDFPGKSTGVGCHFLLQGIFLTQGSNPGLLHCRQMIYPLSHQGSPEKIQQEELHKHILEQSLEYTVKRKRKT